MEFPVCVKQVEGEFVAEVLGRPDWRASHPTWDGAIDAIKSLLAAKVAQRELTVINVPLDGWMAVFGKFRDDPTILEICEEAYRERDRERDELLKELE